MTYFYKNDRHQLEKSIFLLANEWWIFQTSLLLRW